MGPKVLAAKQALLLRVFGTTDAPRATLGEIDDLITEANAEGRREQEELQQLYVRQTQLAMVDHLSPQELDELRTVNERIHELKGGA
jgi:hypothetical protein